MWEVGNFVKVMRKTVSGGNTKELIPIGTICKIKEVCQEDDGTPYYGITPIDREDVPFYYLEKELEKGQIVWVPDAPYENEEQKEDKMDTREEFVGKFELGNKVDITDPCYNKGAWCRMTTDCKPGTWYGYATISDEGEWGDRVAMLCIYLEDRKDVEPDWELIGDIGVDAGMAGFFRDKPDYTDGEWKEFCERFDHRKCYAALDYGVVSESGHGDGGYDVYTNADRSAFMVKFIYDEEE